jgi:hypothetical protein
VSTPPALAWWLRTWARAAAIAGVPTGGATQGPWPGSQAAQGAWEPGPLAARTRRWALGRGVACLFAVQSHASPPPRRTPEILRTRAASGTRAPSGDTRRKNQPGLTCRGQSRPGVLARRRARAAGARDAEWTGQRPLPKAGKGEPEGGASGKAKARAHDGETPSGEIKGTVITGSGKE